MAKKWYVIRTKPRKEDALWNQLHHYGFEGYYPRLRVQPVNPRSRKMVPYFPGYIFLWIDLEEAGISTFQWMPYAQGLVYIGGEPAVVPDNLIPEIKKRLDEINEAGGILFDGLKPGDKVVIKDGPFKGYGAIFDTRISGSERVRVLLKLLDSKRQVPLELDASQIDRDK
jgi:transcriptional antiterminator RfaH